MTRHSFLSGAGELGGRIAAFDWSRTGVGPIERWPDHMKTATSLMLRSQVAMVMLWGESGVMIYNDAYAVFAGERHPELLGVDVRDAWVEVADFNDAVMKRGLRGESFGFRDQPLVLRRNGHAEDAFLDLDYSPVLDDDGRPVAVLAIVADTTSKVLAQRRLSGERQRLARLFDQSPSFMAMLDGPEHRIELANPPYMALIGHRDVFGKTIAEALPDAAAQGYVELLDDVFRSGRSFQAYGARYAMQAAANATPVDRYIDFVFQPIRDGAGAVSGIFVEGVDVTSRVLAERRSAGLARLAERFRVVDDPAEFGFAAAELLGDTLGASRAGYGSMNDDGYTLHVERDWTAPGVASRTGDNDLRPYGGFLDVLRRNEMAVASDVRNAGDAFDPPRMESREVRAVVLAPVVEQGRLVAVIYATDVAPRVWHDDEISLVREVADRTRSAVERARAVQALRLSEARLRDANETLEAKVATRTRELQEVEARLRESQKMEAIGQLTGGIAHDFNNLLATVSGSLQVLDRRLRSRDLNDAGRFVEMAEGAVRRAASLTQRLLAFSRRQTLDPKAVDVNRLVAGLEEMIDRTVGPAVEVVVKGSPDLWVVKVDPPQLENALLNLCINARDAMGRSGGRLTIQTTNHGVEDEVGPRHDLPTGDYISICVIDTGTGMTAEVAKHAFEPFFTTKPAGEGTGLGLSMVYGFVRQSGGQVRLDTAPGAGTTVCVYLPRHDGVVSVDKREGPAEAAAPRERCIVLVEDEETIREILTEELTGLGYRVLEAGDGPAGLRILQSAVEVDLLLTDVGLPGGMNGRQVADAARVSRPDLKVLFITGYVQSDAVRNGLLDPGMEVITKPFDIDDLAAKVAEMISRTGASPARAG